MNKIVRNEEVIAEYNETSVNYYTCDGRYIGTLVGGIRIENKQKEVEDNEDSAYVVPIPPALAKDYRAQKEKGLVEKIYNDKVS